MIYIIEEILEEDLDSDTYKALQFNGIESPDTLCKLKPYEIWTLAYPENDNLEMLKIGATEPLQAFKYFLHTKPPLAERS